MSIFCFKKVLCRIEVEARCNSFIFHAKSMMRWQYHLKFDICRYLAEIGALHLLDGDDQPLSLKDIYSNVLHNKNGCCWEAFEVYKHLKSLGYIIGRHGKPWTMKSAKANSTSLQAVSNFDEQVDGELEVNNSLTELFSGIQIKQVRPLYNVYLPDGKFKKSSPDHPSFVLCLTR